MVRLQKNDKTERARGLGRNTEDRKRQKEQEDQAETQKIGKRESNDSPVIPDRERLYMTSQSSLHGKAKQIYSQIKQTRTKCTFLYSDWKLGIKVE